MKKVRFAISLVLVAGFAYAIVRASHSNHGYMFGLVAATWVLCGIILRRYLRGGQVGD